jgi:hypothetical protein
MRPEHWLYTIPLRLRSLFRRAADVPGYHSTAVCSCVVRLLDTRTPGNESGSAGCAALRVTQSAPPLSHERDGQQM